MKRPLVLLFALFLLSTVLGYSQDQKSHIASNEKKTYKKSSNVHPTTFNNVYEMLRMEPGVMVVGSTSGGDRPKIYVRGISTNSDNTEPLFVVDGTIVNDISYLHPTMVAQIEILKDATAAIYGLQGGNGVIMITTVSGREAMEAEAQAQREAKEALKTEKRESKALKKAAKAK